MEKRDNYVLHIVLFLLTLLTTLIAGGEWVGAKSLWGNFIALRTMDGFVPFLIAGIPYSLSFLGFLTFHEFGHYFMARIHKIKTSLPYYIPFFIPLLPVNIGSMGAIIRLRQAPVSTKQYFDIGIAGPLAGFVVSIGLLVYGFTHLPNKFEYVTGIHPEYVEEFQGIPTEAQLRERTMQEIEARTGQRPSPEELGVIPKLGTSLLFEGLKHLLVKDMDQFPPWYELMHYPFLVVGFLSLFFTALNLLPIGQLDGGHITFGLFGPAASVWISRITIILLILIGGAGAGDLLNGDNTQRFALFGAMLLYMFWVGNKLFPSLKISWLAVGVALAALLLVLANLVLGSLPYSPIWLLYSLVSIRFLGVDHPAVIYKEPLNPFRKVLGWLAILIFLLSFSPMPLDMA